MKSIKSRVSKFSGKRKIIEIPFDARDSFEIGDEVLVQKVQKKDN